MKDVEQAHLSSHQRGDRADRYGWVISLSNSCPGFTLNTCTLPSNQDTLNYGSKDLVEQLLGGDHSLVRFIYLVELGGFEPPTF